MGVTHLQRVPVRHPGHIDPARRLAGQLARKAQLRTPADWGLVVTELGHNLLDHGGGGLLFLGLDARQRMLTAISVDRGPGIVDIEAAMKDGFSTRARSHPSLGGGIGLGTVRRKSRSFHLWSEPGAGTVGFAMAGDGLEPGFCALVMPARHRSYPSSRLLHARTRTAHRFAWLAEGGAAREHQKLLADDPSLALPTLATQLNLGASQDAGWIAEVRRDGGVAVAGSVPAQVCADGRVVPEVELASGKLSTPWKELLLMSGEHPRACSVSGSVIRRSAVALWGANDARDVAIITTDRRPVVAPLPKQEPS